MSPCDRIEDIADLESESVLPEDMLEKVGRKSAVRIGFTAIWWSVWARARMRTRCFKTLSFGWREPESDLRK
jgi:hypothetical protein